MKGDIANRIVDNGTTYCSNCATITRGEESACVYCCARFTKGRHNYGDPIESDADKAQKLIDAELERAEKQHDFEEGLRALTHCRTTRNVGNHSRDGITM